LTGALALSLAATFAAVPARAAFQEEEGGGEESTQVEESDEEDEGTDERFLAIVGGDIHAGDGTVLRGATLLARNGKIKEIGYDVDVPDGAEVVDAEGLRVYPGLVAISSGGLLGSSSNDIQDTIDPFNPRMVLGLASGITATGTGSDVAKLKRFSIDGALMRTNTSVSFKWDARDPQGKDRLREKFVEAARYMRKYAEWQEKVKDDKELKEPSKRGVDTSVLAVLRGETFARFGADDRDDLLGIARLAQTFGFRPVVEGCREAWTVADELGRAGAFAILTPRERRAKSEELVRPGGSTIENAAILHRSGVQVAVVPGRNSIDLGGIVGRDIMHLPIEADFAVRGGLSEQAALESITIVPARIMGVSHRVGTLAVGKDCDAIVTDGDILHYQTFVQYAVVDGKLAYDKQDELWFAHIRPRAEKPAPDPGEEVEPSAEEEPAAEEAEDEEDEEDDDGDEPDDEEEDDPDDEE
jgi:imidazolonepropionase-like amidohydrolase